MKTIYFVRHGETDENAAHRHQPNDATLSKKGNAQATEAEKIIALKDPTHLISSTFTRAAETAEILNSNLLLAIERSDLFVELRRPQYVIGHKHFGMKSLWYMFLWFFYSNEKYWESVRGESRKAFVARVRAAKEYLETFPEDARIVVVSHSIFINFFLALACREKPIGFLEAVLLLMKIHLLENGSVTEVTYEAHAPEGTCAWNVVGTALT